MKYWNDELPARQIRPDDVTKLMNAADARTLYAVLKALIETLPTDQLLSIYEEVSGKDWVNELTSDNFEYHEIKLTK